MRKTLAPGLATALLMLEVPATSEGAGRPPEPPATEMSFHASGLPEFARKAWEATVLLETRTWQGGLRVPSIATGSGLIVARDQRTLWIATSSHVVSCPGACLIRVYLPVPPKGGKRHSADDRVAGDPRGRVSSVAEVTWRDPRRDLALLRVNAPRKVVVRPARVADPTSNATPSGAIASGAIPAGAGVLAIGFPDLTVLSGHRRRAGRPQKRYSTGRMLDSLPGFRAGYVPYGSSRVEGRLVLGRGLTHSADLLPGSSGGPLIDSSGLVLGINTGSLTVQGAESCADRRQRCRVHLAVPIGELLRTIQELKAI